MRDQSPPIVGQPERDRDHRLCRELYRALATESVRIDQSRTSVPPFEGREMLRLLVETHRRCGGLAKPVRYAYIELAEPVVDRVLTRHETAEDVRATSIWAFHAWQTVAAKAIKRLTWRQRWSGFFSAAWDDYWYRAYRREQTPRV